MWPNLQESADLDVVWSGIGVKFDTATNIVTVLVLFIGLGSSRIAGFFIDCSNPFLAFVSRD